MQISFQFFSTKSGKSLAIKINNKAYLFGLFEGFQRYSIQEQFSLVSLNTVFLTTKYNIPALLGMYLTLCESEKSILTIVADFPLNLSALNNYLGPKTLAITFLSSFTDEFISVQLININNTTNFILKLPEIKGQFHPEKIPPHIPKQLYKNLISERVLVFDGEAYNASDFSDKSISLNKICLFFSEITENDKVVLDNVGCVICFTESSLRYFSKQYSPCEISGNDNFNGVFYVANNYFVEYEKFYLEQYRMSTINEHYLLPHSKVVPKEDNIASPDHKEQVVYSGDKLIFDKKKGLQMCRKSQMPYTPFSYNPFFPSVEFLGTGCAIPSENRNVSAILYQTRESAILFDCGEDTLYQIERLHGELSVLKRLKMIYISHSHADHMLGIASIVKVLENPVLIIGPADIKGYLEYFEETVNELAGIECFDENKKINLFTTDFLKARNTGNSKMQKKKGNFIHKLEFKEFEITICGCLHSKTSTSINVLDKRAMKGFSYSGDTRPSETFAFISQNNDLMIHEATFTDGQEVQAEKTLHSLTSEAIDIFEKSNSKKLLLTHFSNRNRANEIDDKCVTDFFRYSFEAGK
ncbi:hypothetical protein GINT2_001942 [Glugoides intestinalis]